MSSLQDFNQNHSNLLEFNYTAEYGVVCDDEKHS